MKKVMFRAVGILAVVAMVVAALASCGGGKSITVVGREDGSGTKAAFMEIIGLKGKADVEGIIAHSSTAAVLNEVKNNPNAIAYDSLGYVDDTVKILSVDGVACTVENIKNGTYKISRPLNIVYKEATLENEVNKAFYDFLGSSQAQKIISDNGYVSTKDGAAEYTVHAGFSGKIGISGSTSLQPLMVKLADKFREIQPDVTIEVSGGGSGTGYKNAENGTSVFGMISESFKAEKAASCTYYEVAKDGIAVIVNKKNAVDDIALDTLKNIYNCEAGDDAVTAWDQVK